MSDSGSDSCNLSLSCILSTVENEESEVEWDLETVEPYKFEPEASNSSAESDT